ncbi:hypothetical protein, partial [Pectobacterium brasiliense]|uniref:hypothetical protein n=1 Tax=Pectobacterium brasiliense TaxID=180957 RepID=UPI0019693DE0
QNNESSLSLTNSPRFGNCLLATVVCRLLFHSEHDGATRYSPLNVNGDRALIDRIKNLRG